MDEFEKNAFIFKALSDDTRLKIFSMLGGGELCACKILEHFRITQPTLSYHMKMLCDSGIVSARRDGSWIKYSLNKETADDILGFLKGISDEKSQLKSSDCAYNI